MTRNRCEDFFGAVWKWKYENLHSDYKLQLRVSVFISSVLPFLESEHTAKAERKRRKNIMIMFRHYRNSYISYIESRIKDDWKWKWTFFCDFELLLTIRHFLMFLCCFFWGDICGTWMTTERCRNILFLLSIELLSTPHVIHINPYTYHARVCQKNLYMHLIMFCAFLYVYYGFIWYICEWVSEIKYRNCHVTFKWKRSF